MPKTKKRHKKYVTTTGREALQRSCAVCHQPPGLECRDRSGAVVGPHSTRTIPSVSKGKKKNYGPPPPSPVRVSFKCPVCAGPHPKKDCPEAEDVVVVEEEPFRIPTRRVAFTRTKRPPVDNSKKTGQAGSLDRMGLRAEQHRQERSDARAGDSTGTA